MMNAETQHCWRKPDNRFEQSVMPHGRPSLIRVSDGPEIPLDGPKETCSMTDDEKREFENMKTQLANFKRENEELRSRLSLK